MREALCCVRLQRFHGLFCCNLQEQVLQHVLSVMSGQFFNFLGIHLAHCALCMQLAYIIRAPATPPTSIPTLNPKKPSVGCSAEIGGMLIPCDALLLCF